MFAYRTVKVSYHALHNPCTCGARLLLFRALASSLHGARSRQSTMTTYGPYKRFTIRSTDAIITITGSNMIATVTGCDGGAPPQDFSFVDVSSRDYSTAGVSKTVERDDNLELESSCAGGNFSQTFHLQSSASDGDVSHMSSVREEMSLQCPMDVPNPTVTHETAVDSSSNDIDLATAERGSPHHSEPEQDCTPPSIETNDGESQLSKSSETELQPIGNDRIRTALKRSPGRPRTRTRVTSPHLCNTCGKTFVTVYSLTQHTRTHTGEKPYSCDTCGRAFATPQTLTYHIRTHTGERPYSCDTCGKAFTSPGPLSQHIRIHTGEKPYSCDICGKSFTIPGNLTIHTRTHTGEKPYSCDTCGKTFAALRSLSYHIHTHTGERPYSCDICGKTFTRFPYLTIHNRVHTGEKPYSCDTCGKAFTTSGQLTRHKAREHTIVT